MLQNSDFGPEKKVQSKKDDSKDSNKKSKKNENNEKLPMGSVISVTNNYQGANGAFSNKGFSSDETR